MGGALWLRRTIAGSSPGTNESDSERLWVACTDCHRRYAVREALAIAHEEGLAPLWARHHRVHGELWEGLTALGLQPFVEDPANRLATVNTIKVRAVAGGGRCHQW